MLPSAGNLRVKVSGKPQDQSDQSVIPTFTTQALCTAVSWLLAVRVSEQDQSDQSVIPTFTAQALCNCHQLASCLR